MKYSKFNLRDADTERIQENYANPMAVDVQAHFVARQLAAMVLRIQQVIPQWKIYSICAISFIPMWKTVQIYIYKHICCSTSWILFK